jgi:hypothetical protein
MQEAEEGNFFGIKWMAVWEVRGGGVEELFVFT